MEKQQASQERAVHRAGPQQERNLQSLYVTLPCQHKAKHNEKVVFANSELNQNNLSVFPNFIYLKKNGNSLEVRIQFPVFFQNSKIIPFQTACQSCRELYIVPNCTKYTRD